jgi:hypothetical protein
MMLRVVLRRKKYPPEASSRDKPTWLWMPRAEAKEVPGDVKKVHKPNNNKNNNNFSTCQRK